MHKERQLFRGNIVHIYSLPHTLYNTPTFSIYQLFLLFSRWWWLCITTVPTNFPAGQTRADLTAAITDDSLIEAMECFRLLVSIPKDLISKGVQVGPNSHPPSLSLTPMVSSWSMALTVSMVAPYVYMNHYCGHHWSFISLYCLCHIHLIYNYVCCLWLTYVTHVHSI